MLSINSGNKINGSDKDKEKDRGLNNSDTMELQPVHFHLAEQSFRSSRMIIDVDPFALCKHYKTNQDSPHGDPASNLPRALDNKGKARQILIDALKMGKDSYFNLVFLLLDDGPLFSEQQVALNRLFAKNQILLLPVKQHLCILSAMQDILRDALCFLTKADPYFANVDDYYKRLITHLAKAQEEYISGHFNEYVGRFLHDNKAYQDSWEFCLRPLCSYLPATVVSAQQGYFKVESLDSLVQLKARIEQDIVSLDIARDYAQEDYQKYRSPIAEAENDLRIEKKKRRHRLASLLLEGKDNEKQAGLPYAYKGKFTAEKLAALGGLVPYDAIEEESGSNIALIALQYKNNMTYRELFSKNKDLAKTAQTNHCELSAEHYDKASFWENKEERKNSKLLIEKNDAKGERLRKMDKGLRRYLQYWYKTNDRLSQIPANMDTQEKMVVTFIKMFNNQLLFAQRLNEAQRYQRLVQEAMKDIPGELYIGLTELLADSDWGPLKQSRLHKKMEKHRCAIEKNPIYRPLYNPSKELLERVKELENEKTTDKAMHGQELKAQQLAHERILQEEREKETSHREDMQTQQQQMQLQIQVQQQQMQVLVKENTVLRQDIQIQRQQLETQQQRIETQRKEIEETLRNEFKEQMQLQMQEVKTMLLKEICKEKDQSLSSEANSSTKNPEQRRHAGSFF